MIIWLIGLSGAGKTAIGRHLYELWKEEEPNTVFMDGDEIREIFKHDRGDEPYTIEGRKKNAERIIGRLSVAAAIEKTTYSS